MCSEHRTKGSAALGRGPYRGNDGEMSAGPASADELSDSQLRHKIQVIKHRPGPLTNQERDHIQNLRDRIQDNDDNDDDDDNDD